MIKIDEQGLKLCKIQAEVFDILRRQEELPEL